MRLKLIVSILAGFLLFGCAQQQKSSTPMSSSDVSAKMIDARMAPSGKEPVLLSSNGSDFFVYAYNKRVYVIGSKEMSEKFKQQHHLPYTRTILGDGPRGETVIFEVVKKKPGYVERLQKKYESTPVLLDMQESYWVWKYDGRIYVIGDAKTNEAFKTNHHLPYTRTILGGGPMGETVIFEVQKKNPAFVDALQKKYENTPFLLRSEPSFWVWKHNGRIYVIGQSKTNEAFKKNHHLPYTKTILGAGPMGETVIFEVDKKDATLADRLVARF